MRLSSLSFFFFRYTKKPKLINVRNANEGWQWRHDCWVGRGGRATGVAYTNPDLALAPRLLCEASPVFGSFRIVCEVREVKRLLRRGPPRPPSFLPGIWSRRSRHNYWVYRQFAIFCSTVELFKCKSFLRKGVSPVRLRNREPLDGEKWEALSGTEFEDPAWPA